MPPLLNRELSWLEFNQRVLNEALRNDLPLLERLKFLAITASNLDEFFQVRVGGLMLMRRSGRKTADPSGFTPAKSLSSIRERVVQLNADQYALLASTLLPAMAHAGIRLLKVAELTHSQAAKAASYFEETVFPQLTPLAIDQIQRQLCAEGEHRRSGQHHRVQRRQGQGPHGQRPIMAPRSRPPALCPAPSLPRCAALPPWQS